MRGQKSPSIQSGLLALDRARIVRAEPAHIAHLAVRMRVADRDEVWAWSGHDPETALRLSLDGSALAWTGLLDEEPACMFGVGGPVLLGAEASPWLLATDAVEAVPRTFARMSRAALAQMRVFPILANWSDARHARAHAWLEWLGFSLGAPQPAGAFGLPFRPFVMRCF